MRHFSEDELIAYQLHEAIEAAAVRKHLEECSACAEVSESIAETLRVFRWCLLRSSTLSLPGSACVEI